MKVISIWQPFATLLARGFKVYETRSWPAPKSLIGQRIGIASTKVIKPEQRDAYNDPVFQVFYQENGLPDLKDLHHGYLLGTAILERVELITEEFVEEISPEEYAYGWYHQGGYAWAMVEPQPLLNPIPIRGQQGIYEWNGCFGDQHEKSKTPAAQEPQDIRRLLRVV